MVHASEALLGYCWGLVTAQGAVGAESRRGGHELAALGGVISSSAPQTLQRSALKEMQGRISTGKTEISLPRADEKRCYKVTCLW